MVCPVSRWEKQGKGVNQLGQIHTDGVQRGGFPAAACDIVSCSIVCSAQPSCLEPPEFSFISFLLFGFFLKKIPPPLDLE